MSRPQTMNKPLPGVLRAMKLSGSYTLFALVFSTLTRMELEWTMTSSVLVATPSVMQVAAKAKAVGLSLTAADIVTRKSIAGMALCSVEPFPMVIADQDSDSTAPFGLSPIQSLFFDTIHENHSYFNQSFSLRLSENIEADWLNAALRAAVAHHAMLRARFRRPENGGWVQQVQNDIQKSYVLTSHSLQSIADSGHIISKSQQFLDIFNGPLLRADLIETDGGQQHLFLVAHHLVMDLVSWRIILADLEEALHTGEISASSSLPFPKWCQMQVEYDRKSYCRQMSFRLKIYPQ